MELKLSRIYLNDYILLRKTGEIAKWLKFMYNFIEVPSMKVIFNG